MGPRGFRSGAAPVPGPRRALRVAFVMPGVGVVERGAEGFVTEVASALARRPGFEVMLFCRGPSPLPHRRIRALPRDQRLVQGLYSATRLGKKVLDTLFLDPLNLEWSTAALAAFPGLWRGRFDALVMEGGLLGAWLARLLRRLRGTPFVDVAHGLSRKWEGAFARQGPDRVVAFTAAGAQMIREEAPRARVVVIPHGVDLQRFRPQAPPADHGLPRPVVLVVGAVDEHKRMDLAVEALAHLGRGSLLVLGQGPEAEALDRRARQRLGPGRYLRTAVPRAEIPGWYTAADCFTLPSQSESFGLVYLEAMACGRPCVAPDDPVRREVVGDAGVYCQVTDPAAYAAALAAALDRDWGERPRRRAEGFPLAATVDGYARLLAEVAGCA